MDVKGHETENPLTLEVCREHSYHRESTRNAIRRLLHLLYPRLDGIRWSWSGIGIDLSLSFMYEKVETAVRCEKRKEWMRQFSVIVSKPIERQGITANLYRRDLAET